MNLEIWKQLEDAVANCRKCSLWKTRSNPVVGGGSKDAKVMFIGEAPGYWEDVKGRPFVGRAGRVLDELLESINLSREEVYITNILKCRPPNNRNPLQSEIEACTPYLDRQIELMNPEIIATLGNFALSYISEKFGLDLENVGGVHGKVFKIKTLFGDITIIPLYHPAAAVYNPALKEVLLRDIRAIRAASDGNGAVKV
ncbi:MAG TPA: uracil-DNA glycosylase [Thermoplasmatales archaeon]|nr:MAG: uracil-DNA glycosylase [Thermoplasmata archaeon]HHH79463.1 uracil-DNA glycosylase [Thermoplasmatales archaeon]